MDPPESFSPVDSALPGSCEHEGSKKYKISWKNKILITVFGYRQVLDTFASFTIYIILHTLCSSSLGFSSKESGMENIDGTNSENSQENRANEEKTCRFKSENEIRKGYLPNP